MGGAGQGKIGGGGEGRGGEGRGEGRKVVRGMWASRGYEKQALGQWLQQ